MKSKNLILIAFLCGLLFLMIQFFIFSFQFINGDIPEAVFYYSAGDEGTFGSFISDYWWSLAGSLLLIGVFVHRITKGPETLLTLSGILLWAVQLFSLYDSQEIFSFILTNIFALIGILLVAIAVGCDAHLLKKQGSDDKGDSK